MKNTLQEQIKEAEKNLKALREKAKEEADKNNPLAITELDGIYAKLNCNPKEDVIKVSGLDDEDHAVLASVADRMRIAKVYNNGVLPTRKDKRWFPWSYLDKLAGSGLVFNNSNFNDDYALLNSASRLSFLTEAGSTAYFKNFQKTEEKIIGL